MAWDKSFLEGMKTGAEIGFQRWKAKQELPQKTETEKAKFASLLKDQVTLGVLDAPTAMQMWAERYGQAQGGMPQAQGGISASLPPTQPIAPPQGVGGIPFVPKDLNVFGQPTGYERDQLKMKQAERYTKENIDLAGSKMQSQYNMQLVAENIRDYSKLLSQSWSEGGAGDIMKSWGTALARKGVVMGDPSRYKTSGAIVGKLFELTGKQFPMISQQIGKEGSVRLIDSIFSRLESSYPSGATPPELAPRMLEETLKSVYRVRRAMDELDIQKFDLNNKSVQKQFSNNVVELAQKMELSPEEEKAFDVWVAQATAPMMPYLAKRELERRRKKGKK